MLVKLIQTIPAALASLALLAAACGPTAPVAAPTTAPKPLATAVPAAATAVSGAVSAAATVAPTVEAAAKPAATAVAAAAPTVAAAAGTAVAAVAPAAGAGGTLNVYLYQKPRNWNPLAPPNGPDTQIMTVIFDALLMVNDRYEYEPRLAEKWTVSPDAKTFTFNLRSGLKWSNGEPFTSKDVLFTYKLLANPASGSAHSAKFDRVGRDQGLPRRRDERGRRLPRAGCEHVRRRARPAQRRVHLVDQLAVLRHPARERARHGGRQNAHRPRLLQEPDRRHGPVPLRALRDGPVRRAGEEPELPLASRLRPHVLQAGDDRRRNRAAREG